MDPNTGLSRAFTMKLRDNRNYYYNRMVFDRESREDSTILHSHLSGIHIIPKDIHDILTGFHDFRENRISGFSWEKDTNVQHYSHPHAIALSAREV